ncbi:DNA/RNA non-specific endonuclease [Saprolegnia parasitica CBS 223.65]|uniref:DNA/RNA non-specific endonuclease n=1 Tax=Saprolegnia parasitica (strain CBS 223.65) TaxID=695850 RepID=A0A067BYE3_SAPPC|nr:DNA/RNA non-specific endonuclease [Saprolegnia parasitica CBS 223.65]KDO23273.1 DNA/RNA non-specific endonuclease [Saprolegnia parasitica CBS 223.65]|eukprot:XP_012206079.1 DNA/RNA non-specific endonuclease [Saprolegnia parasitica CBS 223.65]
MHTSVFAGVVALALQAATALPTCAPIEADVDYWGNDIGRTARPSADDCCADCKNTPGCRLFVWNRHDGGSCWLKSKKGAKSNYPGAKASVINDITVPDQCSSVEEHRPGSFYEDPNMPEGCLQQKSTKAYSNGYDRGHLVTSNHMDTDATIARESHYMNNVVPQVSTFNQGIWVQTEKLQECYRDINPVTTYGGVVYDANSGTQFVDGWGIKTPSYFWKVVLTTDPKTGSDKIIAWFFPNEENLGKLDKYLVSVASIEARLNDGLGPIPVPEGLKNTVESATWALPDNCDHGRRLL